MSGFMDFDLRAVLERLRIPIGVVLSICAVVCGVLFFQRNDSGGNGELRFLTQNEIAQVKGISEVGLSVDTILVDIEGQVKKPGVIELEQGASLFDAVELAGGFTKNVDMYFVQKDINLAQLLEDRQKIYIPSVAEREIAGAPNSDVVSGSGGQSQVVNINTASQSELETISGVGPSTAEKIIEARPYSKIEDIKNVSGIGDSTFEEIKDEITV